MRTGDRNVCEFVENVSVRFEMENHAAALTWLWENPPAADELVSITPSVDEDDTPIVILKVWRLEINPAYAN